MANYAYGRLGTLVIAVADARPPPDAEWAGYLDLQDTVERELGPARDQLRALFFTDGGSATAPQRLALSQRRRGRGVLTAMVTDSPFLHSLFPVFGFINPSMRAFTSLDWPKAAAFLSISEAEQPEVLALAARLGRDIGGEVRVLRALGL